MDAQLIDAFRHQHVFLGEAHEHNERKTWFVIVICSVMVVAMIAILIGYEAITRIFSPVPIAFEEAIPIAFLGLVVNVVSAFLLRDDHHHHHGHGHDHHHDHDDDHDHDHDHHDHDHDHHD